MKYLVVHPNQTEQKEDKIILNDAEQAKEHIEGILQAGSVSDDQISIYELKSIDFQVDRVPIVKIGDETELPKMDIADIPDIITTEEEVAAEEDSIVEVGADDSFVAENNSEENNVEVFTFEN